MEYLSEPQAILRRLYGAFSSAYLTLISIVQGVALGFLATKVDGVLQQPFHLETWLLIGTTFIVYIALWNEYLMGALAFIWVPTLLDAVIPFAFFAAEIALAVPLTTGNLRQWMLALGAIGLVALAAYSNMFMQARRQSRDVLRALGWQKVPPFVLSVFTGCLFVGGGMLATSSQLLTWGTNVSAVALVMTLIFVLRSIPYWNRVIAYAEGTSLKAFSNKAV